MLTNNNKPNSLSKLNTSENEDVSRLDVNTNPSQKRHTNEKEDFCNLDVIEWKWNSQKGRFLGSCYHRQIEKAIAIYQYGLNTIEWSVVAGNAVTVYRAQYEFVDYCEYRFELEEVKTISRAD